jgi:hypothetical protein
LDSNVKVKDKEMRMLETITETGKNFTRKIGTKLGIYDYNRVGKHSQRAINPIMPNSADIVDWVLYDRFTFVAGATIPNQFNFFTAPIGAGGKTKVDTNMELVQQLPAPLWMNVTGVGFWFGSDTIKLDIDLLINSSYVEFWVGQKVYLEGPLQCFPGAAGLSGVSTQTNESVFTNGQAKVGNFFDVRLPAGLGLGGGQISDGLIGITILQNQQFSIRVLAPGGGATLTAAAAVPTPGNGLRVMAYLYGILSRGVQ